jgi:hypothetical protein
MHTHTHTRYQHTHTPTHLARDYTADLHHVLGGLKAVVAIVRAGAWGRVCVSVVGWIGLNTHNIHSMPRTTLHNTILHYTTLHCTTLHYTTLHYTAPTHPVSRPRPCRSPQRTLLPHSRTRRGRRRCTAGPRLSCSCACLHCVCGSSRGY